MLGCLAGARLHVAVSGHPRVEEALLFSGVFFAAYFRQAAGTGSYAWMIFFVTLYVVFLFAILGRWSVRHLVVVRIVDTAVGCAATLAASALIRPAAAGEKLEDELRALWAGCRAVVEEGGGAHAAELLARLDALRARRRVSVYEDLFFPPRRRRADLLVRRTAALCHVAISLARSLAAARSRSSPPGLAAVADAVRARALADLDALLTCGDRGPAPEDLRLADDDLCAKLGDEPISRSEFARMGAALDYAEELERLLGELRAAVCA